MSSFLPLQQCPACLVPLIRMVFEMGGGWAYSCCFLGCCIVDLFNIVHSILLHWPARFSVNKLSLISISCLITYEIRLFASSNRNVFIIFLHFPDVFLLVSDYMSIITSLCNIFWNFHLTKLTTRSANWKLSGKDGGEFMAIVFIHFILGYSAVHLSIWTSLVNTWQIYLSIYLSNNWIGW